ncbi:MAG: hypothetical protein GXP08_17395 [Gammaproteobacteria bacterium]|nr:hypothetical protein [Gammaproteobacteria bacterium]
MAQKKIWVTWMTAESGNMEIQAVGQPLADNGLMVSGADWVNDVAKMAWKELVGVLLDPEQADIWLIACDQASFTDANNRYALSLTCAMLKENRNTGFSSCLLGLDFKPEIDQLPTLLRDARLMTFADNTWAAGVAASAFMPMSQKNKTIADYRFTVRADPTFGQWFEVGPNNDDWAGVMLGVTSDAKISHHAVGSRGVLPEKTVLEYQIQNMKAKIADTDFIVWSVQNKISKENAYFVRVDGNPTQIIFGGHPGSENAEVSVITLS